MLIGSDKQVIASISDDLGTYVKTREWERNPTTIQDPTTSLKFLSLVTLGIYAMMKYKLLHLMPLLLKRGMILRSFWILEAIYAALINPESHIRLPVSRRDQSKRRSSSLTPESLVYQIHQYLQYM